MNVYYCQLHGQYQPNFTQQGLASCPHCQQSQQYGTAGGAGGMSQMSESYRHQELMTVLRAILEQLKATINPGSK